MLNDLNALFAKKKKRERLISIDIGASSIKLMELDTLSGQPRLVSIAMEPTPANSINNYIISKPEQVAAQIRLMIESNDVKVSKVVVALPGPCVFTKKVTLGGSSAKDLASTIEYEAGNYIPHKIDAVHLDFQILRSNGKSSMDVLLVAVKNEIINSFIDTLRQAGLEPSISDVDYFALENMFELNYPEEKNKTVALVNIGARYTSVNILQDGISLFTGDVGVVGRLYTDALCETINMQPLEAERAKAGEILEKYDAHLISDVIDRTTEHLASELHRQIGFFWNTASTERSIEGIYVCGGGSQVPGLIDELNAKTGVNCNILNPFRVISGLDNFEQDYINELAPAMGVSVGLALRRFGDKVQVVN